MNGRFQFADGDLLLITASKILHGDDAVLKFTPEDDGDSRIMLTGFLEKFADIPGALVGTSGVQARLPHASDRRDDVVACCIISADDEDIRSGTERIGINESTILQDK